MNRISIAAGLAIAILFLSVSNAEPPKNDAEPKQIPLDKIWAWKMPGTKNLGKLDAVKTSGVTEHPIINEIGTVLVRRPAKGEKADPAFVVEGVGKKALENAQAVFKKGKKTSDDMPTDTELSVVFYSHSCGQFVHLVSVEKSERGVTVKYRFVAHTTANNTSHIALIPIGKFTPGVVDVNIEQQKSISQAGEERSTMPDLERLVSASFSFKVRE